MPDDVKESALAARLPDLGGYGVTAFCPADQRANVNDWNGRDFFQYFHMTVLILERFAIACTGLWRELFTRAPSLNQAIQDRHSAARVSKRPTDERAAQQSRAA